jgi:predicted acetylornithine/succinylornithine family transaminase
LPGEINNWQEMEQNLIMRTVNRLPLLIVRGEGAKVWDDKGKEYLDFVGGWAVNSLGHCHPVIVEALEKQARILIQTSNQFYTIPQIQLAELLISNSCFDRIFFCNSGAEANEAAIKLARRYGMINLNGAYEIITTHNSFHGRTLAMVAATGQKKFQEPYIPIPNGFINVEYNNVDDIRNATTDRTCAVMVEPIQGEGGVNIPESNYLKEIRDWCDRKGILLILDEVQTGIGRIGELFGYQHYGVEPDVITLAKGLGSGVPIGALLAKEYASVFNPGEHGSTFGGNPLVCATSFAVVKHIIENNIPEKVRHLGHYFISKLNELKDEYDFITDVRGQGLLLAVAFQSDMAGGLVLSCFERGLLINQVKPNMIRFIPPLIISNEDIDTALDIFKDSLNSRVKK